MVDTRVIATRLTVCRLLAAAKGRRARRAARLGDVSAVRVRQVSTRGRSGTGARGRHAGSRQFGLLAENAKVADSLQNGWLVE
jgi:hypothetical protein